MLHPASAHVPSRRSFGPLRSLLVEPDAEARLMLELALSIRGQSVTSCEDARTARQALAEGEFPLIVMNRSLPDADSLRFCSEVRSLPGGAQSTIMIITGNPTVADQTAATEAGADAYIAWPVDAGALRERLDHAEQRLVWRSEAEAIGRGAAPPSGGATGELFLVVNADGSIRLAGDVSELLLGFPPEALAGVNAFSFFHSDDASQILSVLVEALARPGQTRAIEARVRRDCDNWRTVTMSATSRLDDPQLRGIVFELRGPDARVQVADRVTRSTMHDRITNLPNRSLFADRVDHAVARATRRNQPVVVMIVDFNDYASADGVAHPDVSDGLIVALAQRLRSCLRASDTAARLGYDEFGLLLEEIVDLNNVAVVANRIVQAMTVPFYDGGEEIELRPNIGVTVATPERFRAVDLVRDANIARSWARVQGSGRFVMFDPSMSAPRDEPTTDAFDVAEQAPAQPAPAAMMASASVDERFTALNDRIASLEQTILRLDRLVPVATE